MATNKRQLFDAAEYDAKMTAMIEKLRTQKPGQLVGMVGKKDVLSKHREGLKKLYEEGYSLLQIAALMKTDVFEVLPKTLTEIIQDKVAKDNFIQNKTVKPRGTKKAGGSVKTTPATETETTTVASIDSKPTTPAAPATGTVQSTKKQVTQIGDAS